MNSSPPGEYSLGFLTVLSFPVFWLIEKAWCVPWMGLSPSPGSCCSFQRVFFSHLRRCRAPDPGLAECYRVPLPMDLKISPENPSPWRGGESEGLQRLEQHLTDQVSPDGTQGMVVAPGGLRSVPSLAWRRVAAWAWVLFSLISRKRECFPDTTSNKLL